MDCEKKYNEALERAKDYFKANQRIGELEENDMLSDIFPELKESEDERIRKFLHHTFTVQYLAKDKLGKWHGEPVSNILAWLEKQGEQILANSAKTCKDEQKPAWREEDENHIQHISDFIMRNRVGDTDAIYRLEQDVKWLKSIKDRYAWKPSDEQMQCLYDAIEYYQTNGYPATKLKELHEQMQKIYKL